MRESTYGFHSALSERHLEQLHELYQREWWTKGRSLAEVRRAAFNSDFVFALVDEADRLVAFARVLTDKVFKALIFDVIVRSDHRGEGLGRRLMDHIVRHPELESVRHLELYCLPDMVPFYEQWGFSLDVSGVLFMRREAR